MSTLVTLDWALRVCESIAFSIHGLLGVTEPFTGALKQAFGDTHGTHGAMPIWFWPLAGLLLWTVAISNFSEHGSVILAAQGYVAAFHMGAFFYHLRLGHPAYIGAVPTVFAIMATVIVAIRTGSIALAFLILGGCTAVAYALSIIL
eukprot:jgi/Psemu1/306138/fgenesh1_kg.237_\